MADNTTIKSRDFKWTAINPAGQRETGKMRAPSEAQVRTILQEDNYEVGSISPAAQNPVSAFLEAIGNARGEGGPKVKTLDLATSVKQIQVLISAGMTPLQAVAAAVDAAPSKKIHGVLVEVVERMRQGESMSGAFGYYNRTFGESFLAYVSSAETAGTLPETLQRLYEQLSQQAKIESEVKSATAYPRYAGGASMLIALGMVQFLMPQFEQLYAGFGSNLPAPTQLLITVKNNMLPFIGGLVLAFGGVKAWLDQTRNNVDIGEKLDKVKFRLPIFGNLLVQQMQYRWCATMASLQRSTVPLDNALDISARASGSRWLIKTTPTVVARIRDGDPLATSMTSIPLMSSTVLALASVGEQTGELAETLDAAAASIAEQVNAQVSSLGKKIETLTLLFVMAVMGFIIGALWLPILYLSVEASESF